MKEKKKATLPRTTWHIRPVTKVKEGDKKYVRGREKQKLRKEELE